MNIAEGNGKYAAPDRCRFFDIARGSALECAACLDVLVAKKKVVQADQGKEMLARIGIRIKRKITIRKGSESEQPTSVIVLAFLSFGSQVASRK